MKFQKNAEAIKSKVIANLKKNVDRFPGYVLLDDLALIVYSSLIL